MTGVEKNNILKTMTETIKLESPERPSQQDDKKQNWIPLTELPKALLSTKELEKALKPFLEVEAKSRNFNIEIKMRNTTSSIILRKEDGSQRDLTEFLPKGYKFEPAESYRAMYKKKRVQFDLHEINQRGFLLSIAHELGHARRDKKNKIYPIKQAIKILPIIYHRLNKLLQEAKEVSRKIKGLSKTERDKFLEEFIAELKKRAALQFVEKQGKYEAQSERMAWTDGLKILRKLSRDGYDVLNGFDSYKEIKVFIAYCLYTHELRNIRDEIDAVPSDTDIIYHKLKISKPDDVRDLEKILKSIHKDKKRPVYLN